MDPSKSTKEQSTQSPQEGSRFQGVRQVILTRLKQIVSSPVTQFNFLIVGMLFFIQLVHTHAHYQLELDVHGRCKQLERERSL